MAKKILIVDDDRFYSVYLKRLLHKSFPDYELHIAVDGEDAWKMLKEQVWSSAVDILILDLEMPKLNGYGLLKRMSTDEQEFPRVVINSNYKIKKQDLQGIKLVTVTQKPLNYSKVAEAIAR